MKNLRMHIPNIEISLDPQNMNDLFSMMINMQIHRSLLGFDSSGEVIPSIAKSWSKSEDGLEYTFVLGEAYFSDGTPITANHVVNTFARAFFNKAEITGDVSYIEGTEDFLKYKNIEKLGVKEVSRNKVMFKLNSRSNVFLKQIASVDLSILNLKSYNEEIDFTKKASSGPYKIQKFAKAEISISLWNNEYKKAPKEIVLFKIDRSQAVSYAERKQTDYLGFESLSDEKLKEFLSHGWKQFLNAVTMERFFILNPAKRSKQFRQEFASIINQRKIVEQSQNKLLQPAWGAIPDVYPGHLTEAEYRKIIPLLDKPKSIKALKIEFHKNDTIAKQLFDSIKKYFESINIAVEEVALETPSYYEHFFEKKGDILIAGKGIDYPDGYSNLAYFGSIPKVNYFYIDSSDINNLLKNVVSKEDFTSTISSYKEIQKLALEQFTFVPISFGSGFAGLWSDKVKHVPPHPMGIQTLPFELIEME